jgi:hypothetical protein
MTSATYKLEEKRSFERQRLCGVCKNDEDSFDDLVNYRGGFYHSSCANLWINMLDTNLPLLHQIPFDGRDITHSSIS